MIVIFLVMVFNYMDRAILSVLLEPISRDLHLNDAALGLLAGLPFAVLYALVGVPFARVADVGNRRLLIAGSVAVWSVATAACGLATGFASLFMLRVLVGIGEGAGTPAAHSALADNVSTSQRALAASLFTLAATVGGFLGYALGGVLAGEFGWRFAFIAIGAPGVLVAA
jgi:MFS family permease